MRKKLTDINKKIVILVMISLIIMTIFFGIYNRKRYISEEGVRIIIYQQGKETKLNTEYIYFKDLQQRCENIFTNANSALKLIVTKRTVDKVKEATAVEILYSEPKEFTVQSEKPYIKRVDALLISLDNKSAVIYYSMNGSYSSGPLVNTKEEDIMSLLYMLNR